MRVCAYMRVHVCVCACACARPWGCAACLAMLFISSLHCPPVPGPEPGASHTEHALYRRATRGPGFYIFIKLFITPLDALSLLVSPREEELTTARGCPSCPSRLTAWRVLGFLWPEFPRESCLVTPGSLPNSLPSSTLMSLLSSSSKVPLVPRRCCLN